LVRAVPHARITQPVFRGCSASHMRQCLPALPGTAAPARAQPRGPRYLTARLPACPESPPRNSQHRHCARRYQDGTYVVLRLAVRDAADVDMADGAGAGGHQAGEAAAEGAEGAHDLTLEEEGEDVEHRPCVQQ
jgi:hypothetical protein